MDMTEYKRTAIREFYCNCLKKNNCGYNKMEVIDFMKKKPCRHKETTKALKT